jgi:hypothetical protein
LFIYISNNRNPECQEELAKWNIKLDTDLVKFEARILDAEHILYFDVKRFIFMFFHSDFDFYSVLLDTITTKQVTIFILEEKKTLCFD